MCGIAGVYNLTKEPSSKEVLKSKETLSVPMDSQKFEFRPLRASKEFSDSEVFSLKKMCLPLRVSHRGFQAEKAKLWLLRIAKRF